MSGKVWISYHVLSNPSRGLAASEAGGGIGQAIGGADGIPVLEGTGTAHVTLRDQSILLVGQCWSSVTNTFLCPLTSKVATQNQHNAF